MDTHVDGSYVRIFDTTLRDGEQAPGATMTSSEKLEVARALARLGVDVIEAGFPAASPDDLEAVKTIAREVGVAPQPGRTEPPIIAGLARATKTDIDRAWEAVKGATRPRIHTFLATSDLHLQHKLRMTRDEVKARVSEMVAYAKSYCRDVEFSPEDAGRSDPAFLYEVLALAIAAGATTLNIPDTVGYTMPDEFGALIAGIKANVPGVDGVIISVHCHDDLGLAVANTLAGLRAGARQAEVAVNGIGERAGNCSLEEVVMALRTRRPLLQLDTGVDTTQLCRVSKLVSTCTGFQVPPNKAIVGGNAFAHESGIHQDGMLKHQATYEIMKPEDVGISATELVLGKHSGRAALRSRVQSLGYHLTDDQLNRLFEEFKKLADRKKEIYDADLEALAENQLQSATGGSVWSLAGFTSTAGTGSQTSAAVALRHKDGTLHRDAAVGNGPIDALFKAINRITGIEVKVVDYRVRSVTQDMDAQGEAQVEIDHAGRRSRARAVSVDVVEASALAYLEVVNRVASRQLRDRLKPTDDVPQEVVPVG
jgi:2-isopropylmalate synthase